jgi:hypothetical protein
MIEATERRETDQRKTSRISRGDYRLFEPSHSDLIDPDSFSGLTEGSSPWIETNR